MRCLQIKHITDEAFFDSFRLDLSNAIRQVIICSPFLSSNRAIHYYPVFSSLKSRHVDISVYTKPKNEQPESLRLHFNDVQTQLKQMIGVNFYTRPGMHEKISIIDDFILWTTV